MRRKANASTGHHGCKNGSEPAATHEAAAGHAGMRKITVSELQVGMNVVDTGLSWTQHPFLYSKAGLITSEKQIEDILKQGYRDLFIQDSTPDRLLAQAHAPGPKASHMSRVGPELPGRADYQQALALYDDSFDVIKSFILAAKLGRPIDREASARLVESLIDSVASNPDALVSLVALRFNDDYTYTHSINVAVLAVVFGRYFGLGKPELQTLGEAGLFHDLGKTRIPDDILDKPGRLTPEEFDVVKAHPELGASILENRGVVSGGVLKAVRCHHEKFNGTGYPLAVSGDRIPLSAQILSLADSYDAMTSQRPYRKAILPNSAMRILFAMRNKDFSRDLIELFIKCLGIYPVGSPVRLKNGEIAMVCGSNPESPLLPTVKIIMDVSMHPIPHRMLDLSSPEAEALGAAIACPLDMSVLGVDPSGFLF